MRKSSLNLKIVRYEPVNLKDLETVARLNGVADGIDGQIKMKAFLIKFCDTYCITFEETGPKRPWTKKK